MTDQPTTNPAPRPRPTRTYPTGRRFNIWTSIQTVISVAVIVATLLTLWTPSNLFSDRMLDEMLMALQSEQTQPAVFPTLTPAPRPVIGIVAGHWGNDSGSVCDDGLTEADTNLHIATLVKQDLINEGYSVDLLQEFDPKLFEYQALALVSIHNDSCQYINDEATGFKVAAAVSSPFPEKANRLTSCLVDRYQRITGLHYHFNTITPDMTSYHAFNEINANTTAAIIETGFLNLDRSILTEQPELVAQGVTAGILCFVRNEPIDNQPVEGLSPQEP
ncbi:MAG: N-acetylmuramoyl-L-alanine amidase [Chloroflexi bacterium]|nr:N-acetylmuramoyl-L-alanine amidase [Anaerolineaceae bacterium]NMB88951.1 N-acetylmuramoyl-L-alanine amidase [Chloroflexota bacterium]